MMRLSVVCFLVFTICFLNYGQHLSQALQSPSARHQEVANKLCSDVSQMEMVCMCYASNLVVIRGGSTTMTCGSSQLLGDMTVLPIIRQPVGVTLEDDTLYTVMIIDKDAPSRLTPVARYWLHFLSSDITVANINIGKVATGTIMFRYNPPTPPPGSGPHTYQILLFQQNKTHQASHFTSIPVIRKSFKVPGFLKENLLCGHSLVGAFEFFSSNPDGLPSVESDRPCPPIEAQTTSASEAEGGESSVSEGESKAETAPEAEGTTTAETSGCVPYGSALYVLAVTLVCRIMLL